MNNQETLPDTSKATTVFEEQHGFIKATLYDWENGDAALVTSLPVPQIGIELIAIKIFPQLLLLYEEKARLYLATSDNVVYGVMTAEKSDKNKNNEPSIN